MSTANATVVLFDVDNTLLDNDLVQQDLRRYLTDVFGQKCSERYWQIFEELRDELGYADYLGALQRYRLDQMHNPRMLEISSFLVDYPFQKRLYPRALDVVKHAGHWGQTAILSDGDVVFQPRKVQRSGLRDAFAGRVLIYIHKEQELADVERQFPAERYILVDDKLRILAAVKQAWGDRVITVFPKQGHYALDPAVLAQYPPADVTVNAIADLLNFELIDLVRQGAG